MRKTASFCKILLLLSLLTALLPTFPVDQAAAAGTDSFYGMHIGNDTNISKAVPKLNDLGVKWVRVWIDVKNWSNPQDSANQSGAFQKAIDLKNAGFSVIAEFNSHNGAVPTYSQAKAYFDWVQTVPNLKSSIDIWEILNELNLTKYWAGTPSEYVNGPLKAAWDSIRTPSGGSEKILGGSWTAWQNDKWSTEITKTYIDAGYLTYIDYAGFHPYVNTVSELKSIMKSARSLFGSKPIILTEWNYKQKSDYNAWKKELDRGRAWLYDNGVSIACFYRLLGTSSEGGWPGVVQSDSSGNYVNVSPFYNMYKYFPRNPIKNEAEQTTVVSATDSYGNYDNTDSSGGKYKGFFPNASGDQISFSISVPTSAYYRISTMFIRSSDQGIYQLQVNGSNKGSTFDMYGSWLPYDYMYHAEMYLAAGTHTITYKLTGKNANSSGYKARIDRIDVSKSN